MSILPNLKINLVTKKKKKKKAKQKRKKDRKKPSLFVKRLKRKEVYQ